MFADLFNSNIAGWILLNSPTIITFLNEYIILIDLAGSVLTSSKATPENCLALEPSLNTTIVSLYFRSVLKSVVERGSYIYVFYTKFVSFLKYSTADYFLSPDIQLPIFFVKNISKLFKSLSVFL